ncbi:tetratricopeptide repeat protein [Actinoplanes sp. NPDC051861]|uniref:tetratricopeptide repeat protein n=1 Tax=Actinoplanes sp. NPDC051861 TaxID=3155170 RepID=UPI0034258E3A
MDHGESIQADVAGSHGVQIGSHNTQTNITVDAGSLPPAQRVGETGTPHNLPPVSAVFEGRDVAALGDLLGDAGLVVGQAAVHGLGGVGKSELANQYARSALDRYTLIWWITAENGQAVDLGLASLTARLHPVATLADAREWALGWLQSNTGWLLVLDNVEDVDDIADLLGIVSGQGRVVVTTRRDLGARWRGLGLTTVRLDVLERAASVRLLVRLTEIDDKTGADRLAELLGDLPLGLQQAAAYVSQHAGMSFDDYAALLTEEFDRAAGDAGEGDTGRLTVAAVWSITMAAVARRNRLAAAALGVMAWLGADPLPETVLDPLADDPRDIGDALAVLASYSMVSRRSGAVSVHRLVQAVTRARAAAVGDSAAIRDLAVDLLVEAAPDDPVNNVPGFPMWAALLPHVWAVSERFPAEHTSIALLDLRDRAATHQLYQGNIGPAIGVFEGILRDRERMREPGDRGTLSARCNLGVAYGEAGRNDEAIDVLARLVEDETRLLGADDPDTMTTRSNLATYMRQAGRLDDAIVIYEQVVADRERVLGPDDPRTLTARGNLAANFIQAGRADEAVALLERVLPDFERILGPDHPHTLTTRSNLAGSYFRGGRVDDAIAVEERSVSDYDRILGADHPETVVCHANLAFYYHHAGRHAEAISIQEQVVADYRRILGEEHPYTVVAVDRLGTWGDPYGS